MNNLAKIYRKSETQGSLLGSFSEIFFDEKTHVDYQPYSLCDLYKPLKYLATDIGWK